MRVLPAAQHPRRDGKDPPLAAPQIWLAVSRILVAIMVAISPPIGSYQSSVSKKHRTHSAPDGRALGPSFKSPTAVMPTGRTCAAHNYDRMPDDPCSPCTRVPMSNPRLRSSSSVTWMGRGFLFVVTSSPSRDVDELFAVVLTDAFQIIAVIIAAIIAAASISSPPPQSHRRNHHLLAVAVSSPLLTSRFRCRTCRSPRPASAHQLSPALAARHCRSLLATISSPPPSPRHSLPSPLSSHAQRHA